tara:strand:+ start:291 stop:620 length:330 start_codon:yes stop_codon:yes gene_type:complete
MKDRISEETSKEINVISTIIFEFYIYGRDVKEQKELSDRISNILADNKIQKDTDLWKKAWRMYYDWIHFINWRRKKTSLKERDKEINEKISEMVEHYNDDTSEFDDLPF